MNIICILVFFCSYVLITCLHPACGEMRSLVLARDDNVGGHCIWWVYTFFRQKNIRTKVMTLNCTDVCSSELDNTLSHSMLSICDAGSTTQLL